MFYEKASGDKKREERLKKRIQLREEAEKKKRFGLTPEKKRKLRSLIRKKAAEDLKTEASQRIERKAAYLAEKIQPLSANIDSLSETDLINLCKQIHKQIELLENEKYDLEYKIRCNDYEINEANIKINDIAGKFAKPHLRKVSKVEGKLHKIKKELPEGDFRKNLKSTGINKFALQDGPEKEEKFNLREQLKSTREKDEKGDYDS